MKKTIVILVMLSLFIVIGCGNKLSKYIGTYEGMYTRYMIDREDVKNVEEFKLVLNKNGKGKHYRNEEVYDVKWSVKDNKITVIEKSLETELSYSGELKDNILTLYNGDESLPLTLQLVYERK